MGKIDGLVAAIALSLGKTTVVRDESDRTAVPGITGENRGRRDSFVFSAVVNRIRWYYAAMKGRWPMTAEMTGMVENGVLKLDAALPFPDRTRVKLTIETVGTKDKAWAAWQALLAKIDEHPIVGVARPFSRDELYERD